MCLNLLRKDWKPVLDTQAVIHGLLFLFLEPNPDDPLNERRLLISLIAAMDSDSDLILFYTCIPILILWITEAAAVLREDKRKFARYVDQALKGGTVDSVQFPKNKTYKG